MTHDHGARTATVRVWEDFIICVLHHAMHEVGEDIDEAGIGLELVAGWLSIATMHGNGYLQGLLGYAKDELLHRKEWADRRMEQLEQVEHENVGWDALRFEMGKKRQEREQEEERRNDPAAEPSEQAQTMPAGRMEARKRAVAALPPEQRERGYRLLSRSDALGHAVAAVQSEETPIEELREQTLEVLSELRDEANAEFARYREEVGIPGL